MPYTFRGTDENGNAIEVALADAEALDFAAGTGSIGYAPSAGEPFVEEDGTLGERHTTAAQARESGGDGRG